MTRTLLLFGLNIAAAGFFVFNPHVDLAVSRSVYSAIDGFHLGGNGFLLLVRDSYRAATIWIVAFFAVVILAKLRNPHWFARIPMRTALFVVASYVIVAGLFVSLVKAIFDRPRPRHLTEFGGSLDFSRAWQDVEACAANCSFFSGEAATATAMFSLAMLAPRPHRPFVFAALTPLVLIVSLNRVAFGAHFLSDVVAASLFTLLAMDLIWRMLKAYGPDDRPVPSSGRANPIARRAAFLSPAGPTAAAAGEV